MFTLLIIPVESRRDVIYARRRARRVADLLRFEAQDQALVAAATFAIANQGLEHFGKAEVQIQSDGQSLFVFVADNGTCGASAPPNLLRLEKVLPRQEFSIDDLKWISQQIYQLEPINLFHEIARQNQEMLALLHALHIAKSQLHGSRNPSAA